MEGHKLKPCPFCGELPLFIHENTYIGICHKVKCNNFDCWICPETSYYTDEATAIEAWNERIDDSHDA